jgi:16S rRNA (uracil1498-N3)-methyltransferase
MRLHRFYIGAQEPRQITDETLIHQWRNVFRMKEGDPAILFDDKGIEYTCALYEIKKKSASWSIQSSVSGKRAQSGLILCAALIKKDNFDLIIRQATELGVTRIIPIISERSEKKGLNMERARRILIEASEQCGRVDIPIISEPSTIEAALSIFGNDIAVITFEPRAPMLHGDAFTRGVPALMIGPEGGWSDNELELLKAHGQTYALPTFVLRAETAAAATLAIAKSQMPSHE